MSANSLQVTDPGVLDALTRALGHGPPFTVAECEGFGGALVVSDARDLSLLRQLSSLMGLEVFGSELEDLTAIAAMRDLRSLRIIACPVANLDSIRKLLNLEELEVSFTFVEDAAPILMLPELRRARLLGNPLTRNSYDKLRGAQKRPASEQHPPAIQLTRAGEWQVGRRLHERGIALCVSAVDWRAPLLVKPGVGWRASRRSTLGEIDSVAKNGDRTTEAILALPWPPETAALASDIVSARAIGDSADALGWIDRSDLPREEAAGLRRFVSGFSDLSFYRDGEPNLAYKEQVEKVKLPDWYRKTRMTLGFALPGEWVTSFLTEQGPTGFRIELVGYDSSQTGPRMRDARLYPVAIASDRSLTFAIGLDGRDRNVYALNEDWYLDEPEEKADPWVAFPSYARMLTEIVSIRREDGTLVQRADLSAPKQAPVAPGTSATVKKKRGKRT